MTETLWVRGRRELLSLKDEEFLREVNPAMTCRYFPFGTILQCCE
jgi:hypothetical protein